MSRKPNRPGAQTHDSAPVEVSVAQFDGRGTKVLVVDDLPGMRAVAATLLRSAGYEVETAGGGREALSRIKHARPDWCCGT